MKDVLRRYISHELMSRNGDAMVGDDDDLLGSGIVDSVGMMSLVLFVEEEFAVSVPPEDVTIENFLSINTIATYLRRQRSR